MEKITAPQLKKLHTLLNELGLMQHKADLVAQYSATNATSSKDLTILEARALIDHLERSKCRQSQPEPGQYPEPKPGDKMRRKIFAICREIGWIEGYTKEERAMNRAKINSFCIRNSYLKKPLNSYTLEELPKLVSQFEQIAKHVEKTKLNKEAGQAVQQVLAELGLNK